MDDVIRDWTSEAWLGLARHGTLAVLSDLDGTLIPFAADPRAATLDAEAVELLAGLGRTGAQVVVVTGRPQPQVDVIRRVLPDAWWLAEHGTWQWADGRWHGPRRRGELDDLAAALEPLLWTPGVRVERKTCSLCLHWRAVAPSLRDAVIGRAELACDEWLESHPDHERLRGVELVEVRERSAHKGLAVAWVRGRLPGARLIALGDDLTDEDMFAALGSGDAALAVGARPLERSHVAARLDGPSAVRRFLAWLRDARHGELAPPPVIAARLPAEPARARILVVANRTPPPEDLGRGRPVGGLVAALEPALEGRRAAWLGWSGHERDGAPELVVDDRARPVRVSFDLTPELRTRFYGGFCNRALWPLLHSLPGRVAFADADWRAYGEANELYARLAAERVDPDGTVWVHDFHLLQVARALRARGHRGPVGLFLHVPFPSPDLFETLPWHVELLRDVLAFDLVGFHTARWAAHFRAAAAAVPGARVVGDQIELGANVTAVGVFPIGVDTASLADDGAPPTPDVAGLTSALGARRLILGVDRLDYAKGIPERLLAFEHLLERAPEWRGQVSFVQVSVPSRADVPEYAELRARVETLVGRINGRFGEAYWVPVRYLYRSYDRTVLAQLYRAADVGLVTPLRDGMNLVAKEFVAAQRPAQPGVLVLSRFAGAADELVDAVITNPFHPEGMAADLDAALRMPLPERVARQQRLFAAVAANPPRRWAEDYLAHLATAAAARGAR